MNPKSQVKYLTCPSGITGVIEYFADSNETVRYTFYGISTFDKLTPEDRKYITKTLQEIASGS